MRKLSLNYFSNHLCRSTATLNEFKANLRTIIPVIYDTKHISLKFKKNYKQAKELYESTALENLYMSLNREISKKCALYLPSIKHSPESSSYGELCKKIPLVLITY